MFCPTITCSSKHPANLLKRSNAQSHGFPQFGIGADILLTTGKVSPPLNRGSLELISPGKIKKGFTLSGVGCARFNPSVRAVSRQPIRVRGRHPGHPVPQVRTRRRGQPREFTPVT